MIESIMLFTISICLQFLNYKNLFFHLFIIFGSQLKSSSGTFMFLHSWGLVYCGYSFFLFSHGLKDSSFRDSLFITHGKSLTIQSTKTIAANSQLDIT